MAMGGRYQRLDFMSSFQETWKYTVDDPQKAGLPSRRIFVATDAQSYNQTPFLVQNMFSKRRACLDLEDVRFEDWQL
jgi:hypothetical protein